MKLDEMMRDAVAPVQVDVLDLTTAARARGTVRRRQRRLAVVLAGVGAAAAVTGVAALVAPTPGSDTVAPAAPTVASDSPSPVADVPLDGRSTVAVLRDLLGQVGAVGATDSYGGQGAPGGAPDTYGDLHLTPPGEGLGEIGVNVQGRDMLGDVGRTCEDFMVDCTVRTLAGGDVLRLYSDPGPGQRRVAELLSEQRGIRVVVSATNGLDLSGNRWEVTREGTVLDDAELTAVATDGVWAFRVPASYAEQGATLSPYTDYDAAWPEEERPVLPTPGEVDADAQPSAEPSE